jgi:hypothetical protein
MPPPLWKASTRAWMGWEAPTTIWPRGARKSRLSAFASTSACRAGGRSGARLGPPPGSPRPGCRRRPCSSSHSRTYRSFVSVAGRQLGGRRPAAVSERLVEAELVAEVDAEQIPGAVHAPDQLVAQGVSLGGERGGVRCLLDHGGRGRRRAAHAELLAGPDAVPAAAAGHTTIMPGGRLRHIRQVAETGGRIGGPRSTAEAEGASARWHGEGSQLEDQPRTGGGGVVSPGLVRSSC